MKRETKKNAVYKSVIDHYKEETVYITEDGQKFSNEKEAINHERSLEYNKKWDSINKKDFDMNVSYAFDTVGYFASNEEELEMIKTYFNFYDTYNYVSVNGARNNGSELKVGEWILYYYEDGGDYRGEHYFYTFSYVKKQMEEFIARFS
jgi:hypothetical protein